MEIEGADESMPTEAPVPEPESEPVLPVALEVEEEEDKPAESAEIEAYDAEQYATF